MSNQTPPSSKELWGEPTNKQLRNIAWRLKSEAGVMSSERDALTSNKLFVTYLFNLFHYHFCCLLFKCLVIVIFFYQFQFFIFFSFVFETRPSLGIILQGQSFRWKDGSRVNNHTHSVQWVNIQRSRGDYVAGCSVQTGVYCNLFLFYKCSDPIWISLKSTRQNVPKFPNTRNW